MIKILFQAQYRIEFNVFDALPRSDVFIAKRVKSEPMQWQLFDAYKLNYGYDIEISLNGMIVIVNDEPTVVEANFSPARRRNLKGIPINCGLVVNLYFNSLHDRIRRLTAFYDAFHTNRLLSPKFSLIWKTLSLIILISLQSQLINWVTIFKII